MRPHRRSFLPECGLLALLDEDVTTMMSEPRTSSPQQTEAPRVKEPPKSSKLSRIERTGQEASTKDQHSKVTARHNKKNDNSDKNATNPNSNQHKSGSKAFFQQKDDHATQMIFHSSVALMIRKLMITAQVGEFYWYRRRSIINNWKSSHLS